jgi:ABC-type polysaccharide/polyol phosphate transport system ATPase subunit
MIDLRFANVSKRYEIRHEPDERVSGNPVVRRLKRLFRPSEEFWAVRNVSFEVERGEALGIIGHNGAGKSTVLKLLSNITAPTSGEITIGGRLASLIEVGSGFHPELTGRENIFLNGAILGMRRREIAERLDSIVEFAGVAQFIDTPVKRYSSGMYLRLGFSISAHLEPEILLLDEVLAVGDGAFQTKCLERVNTLKAAGTTIVFISHNLSAVQHLCERALLMRRGELVASGPTQGVIAEYERSAVADARPERPDDAGAAGAEKEIEIGAVALFDVEGRNTTSFSVGDPVRVRIEYAARAAVDDVVFEVGFFSVFGNLRCEFTTERSAERVDLSPGAGSVEFFCPENGLVTGTYSVRAVVRRRDKPTFDNIDQSRGAILNVDQANLVHGGFYMPHTWVLSHNGSTASETVTRRSRISPG